MIEDEVKVTKVDEDSIEIYIPEDAWEDVPDDIMKTSNKNCFSCGCTDYDVKFRDELNEWYCDNCCEGMS